jgi:predicted S18 family serine protease
MPRLNRIMLTLRALFAVVPTLCSGTVTITSAGWTVSAGQSRAQLTISTGKLGIVLQNIQFDVRPGEGLASVRGWTAEVTGENQLSIKTRDSRIVWVFNSTQTTCGSRARRRIRS